MKKHVAVVRLVDSHVVDIGVQICPISVDVRERDDQNSTKRMSDIRCIWVQVEWVVISPSTNGYLRTVGWLL